MTRMVIEHYKFVAVGQVWSYPLRISQTSNSVITIRILDERYRNT